MKLVLTDEARADLVRIADWIARATTRGAQSRLSMRSRHAVFKFPICRVRIHFCRVASKADCTASFMATT